MTHLVGDRAHSLLALYYLKNYGLEGLVQRCAMNVKMVYRLLIYSSEDEHGHGFHWPFLDDRISELIYKNPEEFLSLFVDDFH